MPTVLETRELTIKSWQPWENEDGPIRDAHGNYKGNATFDEYSAQPVDATFKNTPEVGDKKYGSIEEYQTKAGKTRLKFQRQDRPDAPNATGSKEGNTWQPRDDLAIRAQWAIGQAVQLHALRAGALGESAWRFDNDWITSHAQLLYAMVDRVKGYDERHPVEQLMEGAEPLPDMPPDF